MSFSPSELELLFDVCLNGRATDEELVRLNALLRADPAARDRYLQLADVHSCLAVDEQIWQEQGIARKPRRFSSFFARPFMGAIAGLVLGLISSSMVWAIASPRPSQHQLDLINAGFEDAVAPLPDGVPVRYGIWSGDYAEIVEAQQGVTPKEGRRMLRFLRSDCATSPEPEKTLESNIYQIVDMRSLRSELADGQAKLDWSAWFNWVPGEHETEMHFVTSVWTFTGRHLHSTKQLEGPFVSGNGEMLALCEHHRELENLEANGGKHYGSAGDRLPGC